MRKASREIKILTLLLLPIIAIAVMHHIVTGFTIYNDGIGYYSYVRSIAIDGNVDFLNEWRWYNQSYSKFSDVPRGINFPETKTPTGKIDNLYLIGSSLMWSPFFFAAHIPSIALEKLGTGIKADGYGLQYETAIGLANIIYGFLGAILIYKLCRKWFRRRTALLATITTWYGTGFVWYHAVEPSMAHMNSVLLTSLFVYFWYTTLGKRTKMQWAILGMLAGMTYLVRQQEILFALLPGLELLHRIMPKVQKIEFGRIKSALIDGMLLSAGTIAMLIPQMLVWKSLQGSYIVYSYSQTAEYWYWTFPQIPQLFLSAESGMWRVPAMLLGLIGVFLMAKRTGKVARYFAAVVIADMLVTSAWTGWTFGYGIRFLLGLSVFFALGLAEVFERIRAKYGTRPIYALAAVLVAANFANMLSFLLREVSSKVPVEEIPGLVLRTLLG